MASWREARRGKYSVGFKKRVVAEVAAPELPDAEDGEPSKPKRKPLPDHLRRNETELAQPSGNCGGCDRFEQAALPSRPIERGRPGPGLLAHILISKFADHLPLYRQSGIYAREGIDLDRSTMAEWVGKTTTLLTPLAEAIARHVKRGVAIHAPSQRMFHSLAGQRTIRR